MSITKNCLLKEILLYTDTVYVGLEFKVLALGIDTEYSSGNGHHGINTQKVLTPKWQY